MCKSTGLEFVIVDVAGTQVKKRKDNYRKSVVFTI